MSNAIKEHSIESVIKRLFAKEIEEKIGQVIEEAILNSSELLRKKLNSIAANMAVEIHEAFSFKVSGNGLIIECIFDKAARER